MKTKVETLKVNGESVNKDEQLIETTETEVVESESTAIVPAEGDCESEELVKAEENWAGVTSKFLQFLTKNKTLAIVFGVLAGIALIGLIVWLCLKV